MYKRRDERKQPGFLPAIPAIRLAGALLAALGVVLLLWSMPARAWFAILGVLLLAAGLLINHFFCP